MYSSFLCCPEVGTHCVECSQSQVCSRASSNEENFGEGNLVSQTENFLNEVFGDWTDSLKALEACEEVLPHAEELHIVSRCINSLAVKASADPSLVGWPESGGEAAQSPVGTVLWNGILTSSNPHPVSDDWWYEDVSCLKLPMYKRLILAVESRAMRPERISGSLMYYTKKYLPLMDQRNLLEEIVELLPDQKGVTSTKFLLRLLRTSMLLHASPSCRENLEKRIGAQLDQAVLEDLIIPNLGYSVETLYDIDCVQRILDHFMLVDRDVTDSTNCIVDEAQLMVGSHSLTRMTMVANLVDGYLAEVAPDVNLKLQKFQSLAAVIPDYARPLDDGIYRAIDIYSRLVNCQKLSLEASTHAAQNERLPLRLIVQVLFFEQLRLRTSIAGWFFVSDNLETSQDPSGNLALPRRSTTQDEIVAVDDMRERVSELEKECLSMKKEIEKLVTTKRSWNIFCRRLGFRLKPNSSGPKASNNAKASPSSTTPLLNTSQNQHSGKLV
ncbi:BTB/POZ domain-containing protein [Vitis vinifera]|uniref:BTB/POZ domain-containing protein n=1 Tax=Vitis vinifera TaxID=29760 RepID=A0A438HIQ2_VITVI|nr:BTB/POZ domain-containing protein [Vitis vinifera]